MTKKINIKQALKEDFKNSSRDMNDFLNGDTDKTTPKKELIDDYLNSIRNLLEEIIEND